MYPAVLELGASPEPDGRTGDSWTPVRIVSPKVHKIRLREPLGDRAGGSDRYDIDEPLETSKVIRIARIERESCSAGCCRDEEIHRSSATRLASARDFGCVDPPIGPGRLSVEGKGIECCFCPL
jgi:hypothetical protein